jgi:hypothetical protein
VRLITLYVVAVLSMVVIGLVVLLLREDCTQRVNELDRAICSEIGVM